MMYKSWSFLFVSSLISVSAAESEVCRDVSTLQGKKLRPVPIGIYHGLGCDSGCEAGEVAFLKSNIPGVPDVTSLEYSPQMEMIETSVVKQIEKACVSTVAWLKGLAQKNTNISEIDLIGHSNGGFVGRGVIQMCNFEKSVGKPVRVRSYISVAGPQAGVNHLPKTAVPQWAQPSLTWIVEKVYWWKIMQERIGPAAYVYNPRDMETFKNGNTILGIMNAEAEDTSKNSLMKQGFSQLDRLLLIRFENDSQIVPSQSAWFGRYKENSKSGKLDLLPMEETNYYKGDNFGLRTLAEKKRGVFCYKSLHTHDWLRDDERKKIYLPFLTYDNSKDNGDAAIEELYI